MKTILIAIGLLALLFVGCIDYNEALVLNADGSGTVAMQYKLANSFFEKTAMFAQQMTGEEMDELDPTEGMLEKEEIERKLAESNSGIKLLSYEKSHTDDAWIWDMNFSFEDINKLQLLGAATSIDDESDPDEDISLIEMEPVYTKQDDGSWLFFRAVEPEEEDSDWSGSEDGDLEADEYDSNHDYDADHQYDTEEGYEGSNEQDLTESESEPGQLLGEFADQLQNLEKEMAKHKIRFAITFPGKIIETNATSTDGNTAVWEYKLNEMANIAEGMRAVIRP